MDFSIKTSFGERSSVEQTNNIQTLKIKQHLPSDIFEGVVWCNNAIQNPNKDTPTKSDLIFNLIDGDGFVFTGRIWGSNPVPDITVFTNTPVLIKGTVIEISGRVYYRLDTLDYNTSATNLPKSMFIKELENLSTLESSINNIINNNTYCIYLLTQLKYLDKFKISTYSNSKGRYLGDKLAFLDFALSSVRRLNSTQRFDLKGINIHILNSYIILYACHLQDMQDFGKLSTKTLLSGLDDTTYDLLISASHLVKQTNIKYNNNFDDKYYNIVRALILAFEETL